MRAVAAFSSLPFSDVPFTAVMTSPGFSPPCRAGEAGYVLFTRSPALSGVTVMPTPENCPFVESLNLRYSAGEK
jgi:hypothetical protein